LFDHVRPLSLRVRIGSGDPQNPPNPGNTEYGIDNVDFEELGQRQLLRVAAVVAEGC
jgi:hypothetical protein